jgi:hypothetical protein
MRQRWPFARCHAAPRKHTLLTGSTLAVDGERSEWQIVSARLTLDTGCGGDPHALSGRAGIGLSPVSSPLLPAVADAVRPPSNKTWRALNFTASRLLSCWSVHSR